MHSLKQISFIDLSRYCRCKIYTGGHFESPCTADHEKCIITKKDCSATNCRVWHKLKRSGTKGLAGKTFRMSHPVQQIRAEIVALRRSIEVMREAKMRNEAILNTVNDELRRLSDI